MGNKIDLVVAAESIFETTILTRSQIAEMMKTVGAKITPGFIWANKVGSKTFNIAGPNKNKFGKTDVTSHNNWSPKSHEIVNMETKTADYSSYYIPAIDKDYVSDANYNIIKRIIASGLFFPTWMTGESGIGKTLGIVQAAAAANRELIRINITEETTERHLIGSVSLKVTDGATSTSWQDGPVITAMRRGAILLLDELDLAANRILCLQPILEGSDFINPHTGEIVKPQPGFSVFATGNTTGQASVRSNKFVGTRILNEAFLDRFKITLVQSYPNTPAILTRYAENHIPDFGDDLAMQAIVTDLGTWAADIHKAYKINEIDTFVTTRRLVDIIETNMIFNNIKKSITLCLNRFDENSRDGLLTFWNVISTTRNETIQRNEGVVDADKDYDSSLGDFVNNI